MYRTFPYFRFPYFRFPYFRFSVSAFYPYPFTHFRSAESVILANVSHGNKSVILHNGAREHQQENGLNRLTKAEVHLELVYLILFLMSTKIELNMNVSAISKPTATALNWLSKASKQRKKWVYHLKESRRVPYTAYTEIRARSAVR